MLFIFFSSSLPGFMQLNPARGRKLVGHERFHFLPPFKVYAAQPREGTETLVYREEKPVLASRFMQLNPARGRKLKSSNIVITLFITRFMQLNPARGRKRSRGKTPARKCIRAWFMQLNPARGRKLRAVKRWKRLIANHGLCSSTPRGDGNEAIQLHIVIGLPGRFMQLNPARGRKLSLPWQ